MVFDIFKWRGFYYHYFLYEEVRKMKNKLHIYYDGEGDFLELRIGKPTASIYEDIGNDVFKRIDEKTGEVRGFAIFNFKKRTEKLKEIDVPLPVTIKLSS